MFYEKYIEINFQKLFIFNSFLCILLYLQIYKTSNIITYIQIFLLLIIFTHDKMIENLNKKTKRKAFHENHDTSTHYAFFKKLIITKLKNRDL